ncbi:MAG: VCBS repeat-containing protein [Gemmatimonadetes bacterium]|nr:VCBS repeat-containing protein [Gemmatimonadota bacterium]
MGSRRGWRLGISLCLGVGMAAWLMSRWIGGLDAEHKRFYETGKMINSFLSEYAGALKKAHADGDLAALASLYAADYASPGRGQWRLEESQGIEDIGVLELISQGDQDFDTADLMSELDLYLAGLTKVKRVKYKIDLMDIERTVPGYEAVLTIKFILDGADQQGGLLQDRYFFRWHVVNEAAPDGFDWKIKSDELVEGVRVVGDRRSFADVEPASIGIDYEHERDPHLDPSQADMRFQMMQFAFGGVSAVDYDADDRPDLFFADGTRSRLYRNEGNRQFKDVTEAAGLDGIGQASVGLFGDMDNDGYEDLIIVRYMATCLFFHNRGDGTFEDRSQEMGFDFVAPNVSATLLDYDRDGYLDLYLGAYGNAFEQIPRLFFFALNGEASRLLRNDGGRQFVDVTEQSGTGDTGWTLAVAAGDYDGNGYPDLISANDFGRKNLYRNNGDGTFSEVAKDAGVLDFSAGMGVAFGDINDDGHLDIYTANVNSNQRWYGEQVTITSYLRNVVATRWALLDLGEYLKMYDLIGSDWVELGKIVGEGHSLFQNEADGTFKELKDSHTNRAGWGWSVAFLDADNDADLDLYAANGWISNDPTSDL